MLKGIATLYHWWYYIIKLIVGSGSDEREQRRISEWKGKKREKVAGICGYDSISSAAGFFWSDMTIGGGKKETETNAAGIIGYNRCENIEYSKVWGRNQNPDIVDAGKVCKCAGKAYRSQNVW